MQYFTKRNLALGIVMCLSAIATAYYFYIPKIDGTAPTRAFYYWKSTNPSKAEHTILDTTKTEVLYIKAFDVDWDPIQGVIPYDPHVVSLYDNSIPLPDIPLVYTVYITNRAMKHTFIHGAKGDISTKLLAKKIVDKITREHLGILNRQSEKQASHYYYAVKNLVTNHPDSTTGLDYKLDEYGELTINSLSEYQYKNQLIEKNDSIFGIQLDCDWSLSTKDRYFELLKEVKKLVDQEVEVSSTLRLWQFKHQKLAGVPPADRVALMLYNMSAREKIETDNSIYDQAVVKQFIEKTEYPLPLDVAIPIFRWGVLFRNGKYKGLLTEQEVMELKEKMDGEKPTSFPGQRIKVDKNYTIGGNWLQPDDEIRPEGTTSRNLLDAQATARSLIKSNKQRLIYYSLQPNLLELYGLENILRGFN